MVLSLALRNAEAKKAGQFYLAFQFFNTASFRLLVSFGCNFLRIARVFLEAHKRILQHTVIIELIVLTIRTATGYTLTQPQYFESGDFS